MKLDSKKTVDKILTPDPLGCLRNFVADDMQKVDVLISRLVKSKVGMVPVMSSHIINSGGKRLRPMLTLACSRMMGYEGEEHIKIAASVEFMHTATLLHDDVVDRSKLRRGLKTANNLWGNKASILVGDYLLGRAFSLMVAPGQLTIVKILSDAAMVISEGEVMQLNAENNMFVTQDEYIEIISAKTAKLFAAACEVGAVFADASHKEQKLMAEYGTNLGIAFQIIDDVLDYSAYNKKFGKHNGNDFIEGKMTLPAIFACERASQSERKFWSSVMKKQRRSEQDLQEAIHIVQRTEAITASADVAKTYAKQAIKSLQNVKGNINDDDKDYKMVLMDIVEFITDRGF